MLPRGRLEDESRPPRGDPPQRRRLPAPARREAQGRGARQGRALRQAGLRGARGVRRVGGPSTIPKCRDLREDLPTISLRRECPFSFLKGVLFSIYEDVRI